MKGLISLVTASLLAAPAASQISLRTSVPQTFDGTTATYGEPHYGESITGEFFYVTSADQHCTTESYTLPEKVDTSNANGRKVVVVDRGKCTFVQKTRVAESKGAAAVVIIDSENRSPTELSRVIVADDGTGAAIKIPTIMISKRDGEQLIKQILAHPSGLLGDLQWTLPTADVVSVHVWGDAGDRASQFLFRDLAPVAKAFGGHMAFTPHVHLIQMTSSINNMCWGRKNHICAGSVPAGVQTKGADIVDEDLRQLCIFKEYQKPTRVGSHESYTLDAYWDYQTAMADAKTGCSVVGTGDSAISLKCSEAAMKKAKIDPAVVRSCTSSDRAEVMLQDELESMAWSVLAIRINGWRFAGNPSADQIAKAVCSAFRSSPEVCTTITASTGGSAGGFSATSVVMMMLLMLGGVSVLFFLYQQHTRKAMHNALRHEVMHEVKSQLADYRQLQDEEEMGARGHKGRDVRPLIL